MLGERTKGVSIDSAEYLPPFTRSVHLCQILFHVCMFRSPWHCHCPCFYLPVFFLSLRVICVVECVNFAARFLIAHWYRCQCFLFRLKVVVCCMPLRFRSSHMYPLKKTARGESKERNKAAVRIEKGTSNNKNLLYFVGWVLVFPGSMEQQQIQQESG